MNAWGKCSPLLGGSSNVVRSLKVAGHMNRIQSSMSKRGMPVIPSPTAFSFFAEEASLHQRPGDADNGLS